MAELGLAASIIGIAGVGAKLSVNLYSFAETVTCAEKNIKAIATEVSLTSAVLEQLSEALKQDAQVQVCSSKAVQTAEEIVEECTRVFKDIDGALEKSLCSAKRSDPPSKGQRITIPIPSRLKWPFLQPKMQLLSANLERLKSTLLLMLQVLIYARRLSREKQLPSSLDFERIKIENLDRSKHEATWKFENLRKAIASTDDLPGLQPPVTATDGRDLGDSSAMSSSTMLNSSLLDDESSEPSFPTTDSISNAGLPDSVHLPDPASNFSPENSAMGKDSLLSRIKRIRTFIAVIDETQRHIEFARSNAYPLGGWANTSEPEGLVVLNPGAIGQLFAYFPYEGSIEWLRGDGECWSPNDQSRFSQFHKRHLCSEFAPEFSSPRKKGHFGETSLYSQQGQLAMTNNVLGNDSRRLQRQQQMQCREAIAFGENPMGQQQTPVSPIMPNSYATAQQQQQQRFSAQERLSNGMAHAQQLLQTQQPLPAQRAETWSSTDLAARRQIQNRLAQRQYRKAQKNGLLGASQHHSMSNPYMEKSGGGPNLPTHPVTDVPASSNQAGPSHAFSQSMAFDDRVSPSPAPHPAHYPHGISPRLTTGEVQANPPPSSAQSSTEIRPDTAVHPVQQTQFGQTGPLGGLSSSEDPALLSPSIYSQHWLPSAGSSSLMDAKEPQQFSSSTAEEKAAFLPEKMSSFEEIRQQHPQPEGSPYMGFPENTEPYMQTQSALSAARKRCGRRCVRLRTCSRRSQNPSLSSLLNQSSGLDVTEHHSRVIPLESPLNERQERLLDNAHDSELNKEAGYAFPSYGNVHLATPPTSSSIVNTLLSEWTTLQF